MVSKGWKVEFLTKKGDILIFMTFFAEFCSFLYFLFTLFVIVKTNNEKSIT